MAHDAVRLFEPRRDEQLQAFSQLVQKETDAKQVADHKATPKLDFTAFSKGKTRLVKHPARSAVLGSSSPKAKTPSHIPHKSTYVAEPARFSPKRPGPPSGSCGCTNSRSATTAPKAPVPRKSLGTTLKLKPLPEEKKAK